MCIGHFTLQMENHVKLCQSLLDIKLVLNFPWYRSSQYGIWIVVGTMYFLCWYYVLAVGQLREIRYHYSLRVSLERLGIITRCGSVRERSGIKYSVWVSLERSVIMYSLWVSLKRSGIMYSLWVSLERSGIMYSLWVNITALKGLVRYLGKALFKMI